MLPITQYTNEDLPYNDSTDFEVVYRINPLCIANFGFATPASLESCGK